VEKVRGEKAGAEGKQTKAHLSALVRKGLVGKTDMERNDT
jgi:hypothetical protein